MEGPSQLSLSKPWLHLSPGMPVLQALVPIVPSLPLMLCTSWGGGVSHLCASHRKRVLWQHLRPHPLLLLQRGLALPQLQLAE